MRYVFFRNIFNFDAFYTFYHMGGWGLVVVGWWCYSYFKPYLGKQFIVVLLQILSSVYVKLYLRSEFFIDLENNTDAIH